MNIMVQATAPVNMKNFGTIKIMKILIRRRAFPIILQKDQGHKAVKIKDKNLKIQNTSIKQTKRSMYSNQVT